MNELSPRRISRKGQSRRLLLFLAAALLVVSGLSACGSGGSGGGGGNGKVTIGFLSFWSGANPFANALAKAALGEGKRLGATVDYVNGNNNQSTQVSAIQNFIAKRVDAIVVFPGNETALVPIVNKAAAAGIPVIDLNEQLAKGSKAYTYVGADNYQYGLALGKLLVEAIGEQGEFALAQGIIGFNAQIQRTKGIKDYIAKYPGLKMVATQSDNWQAKEGLALTQTWASKYPDLKAVVFEGPEGATAAQWAHKNGHENIKFILGDYPGFVETAIKDGYVYGTINQSPVEQAQKAMQAAYWVATGKKSKVPTPKWRTDLPLITAKNVNKIKAGW